MRAPLQRTLFPYTTLFRSTVRAEVEYGVTDRVQATVELPYGVRDPAGESSVNGLEGLELGFRYALLDFRTRPLALDVGRSEEHTSELQSRGHLVCRLLLQK